MTFPARPQRAGTASEHDLRLPGALFALVGAGSLLITMLMARASERRDGVAVR